MQGETLKNSNGDDFDNINAEWFKLKEIAKTAQYIWTTEKTREPNERAKYQQRGKRILAIVNQMPKKHLSDEEKVARIQRVKESFTRAGITNDLENALAARQQKLAEDVEIGKVALSEQAELSAEEEKTIEELRERVIDLTTIDAGTLAEKFPSRNYLYHGSTTDRIEKILMTGGLKNGIALQEDDPKISASQLNSGFEGISWSMNKIDALPGTNGHIAGFLAAPEDVLNQNEQLVVPSRPAPYEVLQVSDKINPSEFYTVKTQTEIWGDMGIGEKNSIVSGLVWAKTHNQNPENPYAKSAIYNYSGNLSADTLRDKYKIAETDEVIWDENLHQSGEIPPALPWIQSLIDRNIFTKNGYEDLDTVEQVLAKTKEDPEFLDILLATAQASSQKINKKYDALTDNASSIRINPEEMYFVTSHNDLENWLKVMARTGAKPKGILLYDDRKVILNHFANEYDGNEEELSAEIGRAIDVNENFWREKIGMDPEKIERSGHMEQVLRESEVKHNTIIRLEDGKLKIK